MRRAVSKSLLVVLAGCVHGAVHVPPVAPPPQPGRAERLRGVESAGDAALHVALDDGGSAEQRYREGELALALAMMPIDAPELAEAHRRRLAELAQQLGLPAPLPAEPGLEEFVAEVHALARRLRVQALDVEVGQIIAPALLWMPWTPGVQLVVRDPSRKVRPFAGSGIALFGADVAPQKSLYLFRKGRLRTSFSLTGTEQPASLEGATAQAVLFTLQPPLSLDSDPREELWRQLVPLLFTKDLEPRPLPEVAAKLTATHALIRRGVIEVLSPAEAPEALPRLEVEDAEALVWARQHGHTVELSLLPLARP